MSYGLEVIDLGLVAVDRMTLSKRSFVGQDAATTTLFKVLQRVLRDVYGYKLVVDGKIGKKTADAVYTICRQLVDTLPEIQDPATIVGIVGNTLTGEEVDAIVTVATAYKTSDVPLLVVAQLADVLPGALRKAFLMDVVARKKSSSQPAKRPGEQFPGPVAVGNQQVMQAGLVPTGGMSTGTQLALAVALVAGGWFMWRRSQRKRSRKISL